MDEIRKLLESEETPKDEKTAIRWLLGRVQYLNRYRAIPGAIKNSNFSNNRLFKMGEMYLYHYDAKWKDTLPYWDAFPLVIPINLYEDGFLGLNLHYLPPKVRIQFLNKLTTLAHLPIAEKRVRLQISYEILEGSNKFNEFVPCVKRYLGTHITSQLMRIYPHEWMFSVYLPIAKWQKAKAQVVYAESMRKTKKRIF